jgi:hypothetical protein
MSVKREEKEKEMKKNVLFHGATETRLSLS